MTYSSDEIESDVAQVVQGSPTFSRDGLGARNVKERFEETRELVNSVMLYEPDSVFYLLQKASIRTRQILNSVISIIDELEEDIDGMAVPAKAVEDTTALADAGTALSAISNALDRRGSISASEWQRYDKATERALSVFKDSAKRTYTPLSGSTAITDVVKSSAESASTLLTNFNTLKAAHQTLLVSVDRLLDGLEDYDHKRVVTAVASRQMSRLQSEMSALESDFEGKTPQHRAETVRANILTVLTNRASTKALSQIRYPGDAKLQQASDSALKYRASAYGTGTPPTIKGTISAPWAVEDAHQLSIDIGGTTALVELVPSTPSAVPGIKQATLTGTVSDIFAINEDLTEPWPLLTPKVSTGGTYTLTGFYFYIVVNGVTFTITDSPGNPWTTDPNATDLATEIDSVAGSYVTATKKDGGGDDWVEIAYKTSTRPPGEPAQNSARHIQLATGPLNAPSMVGGWNVDVDGTETSGASSFGWDGNDELWIWPNDLTLAAAVKVVLPNGSWPTYAVSASTVASAIDAASTELSSSATAESKVEITSSNTGDGSVLKVVTSQLSASSKTPSIRGAETLGFLKDQEARESGLAAQTVIDAFNNDTDFSPLAVASFDKQDVLESNAGYGASTNQIKVEWTESTTIDANSLTLTIKAGENRGNYGVLSYTHVGGLFTFNLDRDLRVPSATSLGVRVYSELLVITALDSGISSYVDVQATPGVFGLPTDKTYGTVEQLRVEFNDPAQGWVSADLRGLGIALGDVIYQEDRTLVATVTDISSLETGVIGVSPIIPTLSLPAFVIESVASDNHGIFVSDLSDWKDGLSIDQESLAALGKSIQILLNLVNPARSRVQVAADELADIRSTLETGLQPILESFSTPTIAAVDSALDAMTQEGHDRARTLLTSAQFSEFRRTTYKTASTSGAMMDAASKVATNDLVEPTKTNREFDSEFDKLVYSSHDDVDPKYDFSDMRADSAPVHLDYFAEEIPGG